MKGQNNTQFSEELQNAVLDTAVNTANLVSILDPMKMQFSEAELVAKATGTTPEYVDSVADLVHEANGISNEGISTPEQVREAFSADLDVIYEANFSNLSESIVAYAKNFSENFDAEAKAAEIGAIIGLLDDDKVESLGEEAVADIISEATNVPSNEIEEALDAMTDDFSENFAEVEVITKGLSLGKKIAAAAVATKNAVVKGAKATGSHVARNKKKYIVGGAATATGGGAVAIAKRRKNYSVLYTEDGIAVEFSEPVEVNFNGPFNGPMVEPVAEAVAEGTNGGALVGNDTGVAGQGGLAPQLTIQHPASNEGMPKPGDKPSDASQALAQMAVKNNLVAAHTAASAEGTIYEDPKFGGPGQENEGKELFSTFDTLVAEIK